MSETTKSGALATWAVSGGAAVVGDRSKMARALRASSENENVTKGNNNIRYLNFSGKRYVWSYGPEKEAPSDEKAFIIVPSTAFAGYTAWKSGKAVAKKRRSIFSTDDDGRPNPITEDELPDLDVKSSRDGWKFTMGFYLSDPEFPGVPVDFATNSKSGVNVVSDINDEVAAQCEAYPESKYPDHSVVPMYPVVYLDHETFPGTDENGEAVENAKPKFVIAAWVSEREINAMIEALDGSTDPEDVATQMVRLIQGEFSDANDDGEETDDDDEQVEAPKKKAAKKAAPKSAAERRQQPKRAVRREA